MSLEKGILLFGSKWMKRGTEQRLLPCDFFKNYHFLMTSQQVLQKTRMIGSMGPVHCAVGSANIFGIACHNDFWNI